MTEHKNSRADYSTPTEYVAGPDDEFPATAGSDDDTEESSRQVHTPVSAMEGSGDPGFRVQGPVDDPAAFEDELLLEEEEPPSDAGHVSADLEWVSSDEDDPDAGSGRTP